MATKDDKHRPAGPGKANQPAPDGDGLDTNQGELQPLAKRKELPPGEGLDQIQTPPRPLKEGEPPVSGGSGLDPNQNPLRPAAKKAATKKQTSK